MSILTIIILVIVGLWLVSMYNGLIRWRNRVKESWADIDVQLKRRYDLIPNLVETVKGYATHEKETLDAVITARNKAMDAKSVKAHGEAENMLTGALKSMFALSEAYPDLKAVQSFTQLQNELADTENKIQASRRFYNSNVMAYNTKTQVFPTSLLAGMFGFKHEDFFEITEEAQREAVNVQF
jgi:LemA protein